MSLISALPSTASSNSGLRSPLRDASAMNDLIEQMHKADAELEKLRAGAKPVAEDPYKKHN